MHIAHEYLHTNYRHNLSKHENLYQDPKLHLYNKPHPSKNPNRALLRQGYLFFG
ncbi:hypothetical protein IJI76_00640 [Candidatus Saccharibacteria bacterium]|nr:hypothetical protein [Candidatus Saccharibacteria bacterium]